MGRLQVRTQNLNAELVVHNSQADFTVFVRTPCAAACACSSIPQKNRKIQEGAINSLALYASIANALVIVAPDAGRHASHDALVNKESYQVCACLACAKM